MSGISNSRPGRHAAIRVRGVGPFEARLGSDLLTYRMILRELGVRSWRLEKKNFDNPFSPRLPPRERKIEGINASLITTPMESCFADSLHRRKKFSFAIGVGG